jgi:serine/threonine protein kinase
MLRELPSHPRIVAIQDGGEERGDLFLVMEWLEGRALSEVLGHGPPPRLERVQRWSRQICLGLAHCHRHQVFHRDVKPAMLYEMLTGEPPFGYTRDPMP